ncbi:MAG: NTP transferase domain-containing protein [Acidimicrobiales bacterium]
MSPSAAPVLVVLAAGAARRYGGCKPLAPVGPSGEAVIDLVASDAVASGFGAVVLVIHPETGPAIRYHVERCWPSSVDVSFAEQRVPLGTTHATLAARSSIGTGQPFAVANADDVYGLEAFGLLSHQLATGHDEHALVGFQLAHTVVTDEPVTRGICEVDASGHLVGMTERRQVSRLSGGADFSSLDGLQPEKLDGEATVSVNLWGFRPEIWGIFDAAMAASGLDEEYILDQLARGVEVPKAEVLLPEVVGTAIVSGSGLPVRVLPTDSRCLGVTHADDLPVVQGNLSRQVAWGTRPSRLWGSLP